MKMLIRWVVYYVLLVALGSVVLTITDSISISMFISLIAFAFFLYREFKIIKDEENTLKKAVSKAKRVKRRKK